MSATLGSQNKNLLIAPRNSITKGVTEAGTTGHGIILLSTE